MIRRIAMIQGLWKRHELERQMLAYRQRQARRLRGQVELQTFCAGSEGTLSESIAKDHGAHYIEVPNQPVSQKHQAALESARDWQPDAVIFMGSDNAVSDATLLHYCDMIGDGAMLGGFLTFWYLKDNKLFSWEGYPLDTHRPDPSVGAGRFHSKALLDRMDWQMWESCNNHSLDYHATQMILRAVPTAKPKNWLNTERDFYLLDVKSSQNLTNGLKGIEIPAAYARINSAFDPQLAEDLFHA